MLLVEVSSQSVSHAYGSGIASLTLVYSVGSLESIRPEVAMSEENRAERGAVVPMP